MRIVTTSTYLTPDIGQAIGGVAAAWSALEYEMEVTIRQLAKTSMKVTRILVTGMNLRTRLGCIEGLMQLRKATAAQQKALKKFSDEITLKLEPDRNKVVQSLWHRDQAGAFHLIRTSGSWTAPKIGRVKRAVMAEVEPINSAHIRGTQMRILDACRRFREWRESL